MRSIKRTLILLRLVYCAVLMTVVQLAVVVHLVASEATPTPGLALLRWFFVAGSLAFCGLVAWTRHRTFPP